MRKSPTENVYFKGIKGLHLMPGTAKALQQLTEMDGANILMATADEQYKLSADDRRALWHALNVLEAATPDMTNETPEFNVLHTALSYLNCFFNDAKYDEEKIDHCRTLFMQYSDQYHAQGGYEQPKDNITQLITKMKNEIQIVREITGENGLLNKLSNNENVDEIAQEIIAIKHKINPELKTNIDYVTHALRILQNPAASENMLKTTLKFLNSFYISTHKDLYLERQHLFNDLYKASTVTSTPKPSMSPRPSASQISSIRMGSRKKIADEPVQNAAASAPIQNAAASAPVQSSPASAQFRASPPPTAPQKLSSVVIGLRKKVDKSQTAASSDNTKVNDPEMKK